MEIQTVIFDLGKTLVPFDLGRLDANWARCRPEAKLLCERVERGAVDADGFRREMSALAGIPPAGFDAWWNSIFDSDWLIPPQTVLGLKRHYRLGLLSNTNEPHFEHLLRVYPELAEFDFHILSHEVGAAKPEAAIYAATERAAGCPPEAILYFDDVPAFVEAARRRGWQAHFSATILETVDRVLSSHRR